MVWNYKSVLGVLVLLILTYLLIKKYRWFHRVLFFSLLLGVFHVISFTGTTQITRTFQIGALSLSWARIPFMVMVALVLFDRKTFITEYKHWFKSDKESVEKQVDAELGHYRKVFRNLSTEEMEHKLSQDLNASARKALEKLIEEKRSQG